MHQGLIGRQRECEALQRLLLSDGASLVTVTGPGGIGKTRLALQVADGARASFEHGVTVALLGAVQEPEQVVSGVARALGLQGQGSQPEWERIKDCLQERRLLLVLDNFEQVLPAASLVAELLREARSLKVLVTSRVRLRLSGEQEFPLGPLELPQGSAPATALQHVASVQLFMQRAQALRPDFQLDAGNLDAVAALCVRLEGWPLAIELAAARIKLMTPQQMLPRLESRLGLLTGGPVDGPQRHRTLRAALDWSRELLDEDERTLFAQLSVFNGGAQLEAIEAVCAQAVPDLIETLQSLVDHSLLQQREGRFAMLETVREYAAERLLQAGLARDCALAHVQYFLQLAEQGEAHQSGPRQRQWFDRLAAELDNFRAALAWSLDHGHPALALRMAGALGYFCVLQGLLREGRGWIEMALARTEDAGDSHRAKALSWAGQQCVYLSELPKAREFAEEARRCYQAIGELSGTARTLIDLGWVHVWCGNLDEARRAMSEGIAAATAAGDAVQEARGTVAYGAVVAAAGEFEAGTETIAKGLALTRAIGDESRVGYALSNLGYVYNRQGLLSKAIEFTEAALHSHRAAANRHGTAVCLTNLGEYRRLDRDFGIALGLLREALSVSFSSGMTRTLVDALENLAHTCLDVGDLLAAAKFYGAADARRQRYGIATMMEGLDKDKSAVQERLGAEAFGGAFAEGRTLSLQDLMSLVDGIGISQAVSTVSEERPAGLTAREIDVLRWVARGLSDKQVARQLGIRPTTVSKHVANLLGKTACSNRLALTLWAMEQGLVAREG